MSKFFDIILIVALIVNIVITVKSNSSTVDVLGSEIPTWVAIAIQIACIFVLGFKAYRGFRKT